MRGLADTRLQRGPPSVTGPVGMRRQLSANDDSLLLGTPTPLHAMKSRSQISQSNSAPAAESLLSLHPVDDFDVSVLAQTAREELIPGGDLVETLKRLRNLNRKATLMPLSEQPDEVSIQWADDHNGQLVARLQLERTLHAQLEHVTSLEKDMDDTQRHELNQLRKKADQEEAELVEEMAQLTQGYRKLRADAVPDVSTSMKFQAIGARRRVSARQVGSQPGEPVATAVGLVAVGATRQTNQGTHVEGVEQVDSSGDRSADSTALPPRSFSGRSFKMDLPPPPASPLRAEPSRPPAEHELSTETRVSLESPDEAPPAHSSGRLALTDAPSPPANLELEMEESAESLGVEATPDRQSSSSPSGSPLPRYLQVELHEGAQKMLLSPGSTKLRVSPSSAAENQQYAPQNSAVRSAQYSEYPRSVQGTLVYAEHAKDLMPSTTSAMVSQPPGVDVPAAIDNIAGEQGQQGPGLTQESPGQLFDRARALLQQSDAAERTGSLAVPASSAGASADVHGSKHSPSLVAASSYNRPGVSLHWSRSDSAGAPAKPSPRSGTPPRRLAHGGSGSTVARNQIRSPMPIRTTDASRIRDRAERLSDRFERRQQEPDNRGGEVDKRDTFSLPEHAKANPATSLVAPRHAVVATVKMSHRDPGTKDLKHESAAPGVKLNFTKNPGSMRAKSPVTIRTGLRDQGQSTAAQHAPSNTYSAPRRIGTLDRQGATSSRGVPFPAGRRTAMFASADVVRRGLSPVRVRFLGESPRERNERLSMSGRSDTTEFSERILRQTSSTLSFEDPRLLKPAERPVSIASQEGDNSLRSGAGVLERLRIGIECGDLDSAIYSWDAQAEQQSEAQSEQQSEQQRLASGPLQFAQRIAARAGSQPGLR